MSAALATRTFSAVATALSDVRRFVADEAARHTFSTFVHDLQLAVTEACANAILHSGTKEIRVSIVPDGRCLEVTVEDDGVYRRKLPVPEADGTGHRGLHLIAAVADDFTLRRGTDRRPGTVVRIVKCKT
jgi:anti-sigma regulatory factor (Ser/Thr protein kinase)